METDKQQHEEAGRTGELLALARGGDAHALGDLVGQVHAELCTLAHSMRRGWTPPPSLSTVEIVNEAYLRLRGGKPAAVTDRRHFMNLAAKTMRWIVISHHRNALQRPAPGSDQAATDVACPEALEFLTLDAALEKLEALHPELAQLVEMRFFLGREMREIAEVMEIPERSLSRLWERARRWLYCAMSDGATILEREDLTA